MLTNEHFSPSRHALQREREGPTTQMSETKAAAEEDAAVMPYKLLTTDDDGDGDSGIGEKKMQSGSPTSTRKH